MKDRLTALLLLTLVTVFISPALGLAQSTAAPAAEEAKAKSWSGKAAITGKVLDDIGNAAPYATLMLFDEGDSIFVKGGTTNDNGSYNLAGLAIAKYTLKVTYVGYEDYSTAVVLTKEAAFPMEAIQLTKAAVDLSEVEVVAARPLIVVEPDKTVFNVDGSINATGNTAMELLRKSPGVIVDNSDNVILAGKDGVQIYIDGRPSPLSRDDLAAMLKNMQSNEIDAIEIITNPSAKYDAEGNAGIINIKLKKNKKLGTNVNLNLGYAYGFTSKYNASASVNYRDKKVNIFGSYSFNTGDSENYMDLYRIQNDVLFDERTRSISPNTGNSFKLGTDFFLNDKNTIGVLVNGYLNDRDWNNTGVMPITDLLTNELQSVLLAGSENDGLRKNLNTNVNYQFDNGQGSSWNVDADWGVFQNETDSHQPNRYVNATEDSILFERNYTSEAPTDIAIYTFKVDRAMPLAGGNFGAGFKSSYVKTDNSYSFYELVGGNEVLDTFRTNDFTYDENVNAAYATWTRPIKKFSLNLGMRVEQTNSKGVLTALIATNDDEVERSYLDFFPSAGLSYQASQNHQFRVNYSRRIDRPNYQDLNPFEFKLSELSFSKGNPFLRPQYTNSYSLSHTFKYRYSTTLSYSQTNDFFAGFSDSVGLDKSFLETINMDYQRVLSLNISIPASLAKWWSTYTNINAFYKRNYADLGAGRTADVTAKTLSLYHQSTFVLPKGFSLEAGGWYSSPSIWGAVYETDGNFSIDAGVKKVLFDGRSNIKVSVTDIFKTTDWLGIQDFDGFYVEASGGWESRQVRVNFSYLFGNNQVKNARKRDTGLDDEMKRVK